MAQHDTTPDRYLTRQQLRELYTIGTANMTIRRWEQHGRFPRRHKHEGMDRWSEQQIRTWLTERGR